MSEPVINENSTHWVTVQCYDRTQVLEDPTTFVWELHDTIDGSRH